MGWGEVEFFVPESDVYNDLCCYMGGQMQEEYEEEERHRLTEMAAREEDVHALLSPHEMLQKRLRMLSEQ